MPKIQSCGNVYQAALSRIEQIYKLGHEPVVSFSAGKDSGALLNCTIEVAKKLGTLPVKVVMRDDEIAFPGTYEFAERTANRKEVDFTWLIAQNHVINICSRENPYWWAFDKNVPEDKWVRKPPSYAKYTDINLLTEMSSDDTVIKTIGFKKDVVSLVGVRVSESRTRRFAISAMHGGYMTKSNLTAKELKQREENIKLLDTVAEEVEVEIKYDTRNAYPIYDWEDKDIWRAHKEFSWDYNKAYDVMLRMGANKHNLRIGPLTINTGSVMLLKQVHSAWPTWYDRVIDRIPGIQTAVKYGKHAITPIRRVGETWEKCYQRTCIDEAPKWISNRAKKAMEITLNRHKGHATNPFPELIPCRPCAPTASWKILTHLMYHGDPMGIRTGKFLRPVDPAFFKKGVTKRFYEGEDYGDV